jgi:hypothetical protein
MEDLFMSDERRSNFRLGLLALLGGLAGGIASGLVHDARAVEAKPGMQPAAIAYNTTDAKVAALEQKVAALRTAYDAHTHTYDAPPGGTKMNLVALKQAMNDAPTSYYLWLQAPAQNGFVSRPTSGPKAP